MPKNKKFKAYKQGIYKPTNKEKCLNKTPFVYRSMLECRAFRFFDNSPSVIRWGSELFPIQYMKGNKPARYYVDIYAEMKINDKIQKYIIEIKPFRQTLAPVASNKKKKSTILYENLQWTINSLKWEAAEKWAKSKDAKFIIITERNIEELESRK